MVTNRMGMASALIEAGFSDITYGDLIFDLGLPWGALRSLQSVDRISRLMGPVVTRLPYVWFYPTGIQQEEIQRRRPDLFEHADILAGDFHNIRRFLIDDLSKKTVLTNTVTIADRVELRERGLRRLITLTPNFEGRSFGANVLNGVIVSLLGGCPEDIQAHDYLRMVERLGLHPAVEDWGE